VVVLLHVHMDQHYHLITAATVERNLFLHWCRFLTYWYSRYVLLFAMAVVVRW
jgi:hypothetical protein